MTRSYGQFCGLAAALDLLGERWTLLVVRELLLGPKRFKQLESALTGAGANLLSARLHRLTEAGVVRDDPVPEDGRGRVYSLTEKGAGLRPVVLELSRWGLGVVDGVVAEGIVDSEWAVLALEAMVRNRALSSDVTEDYEFRIDQTVVTVSVRGGEPTVSRGPATEPALTLTSDARTFVRLGARLASPLQALVSGDVALTGDSTAAENVLTILGLAEPEHGPDVVV